MPDDYLDFGLLGNILKGDIKNLRSDNDTLKLILSGLIVVLFIGYAALLVVVVALLFLFISLQK